MWSSLSASFSLLSAIDRAGLFILTMHEMLDSLAIYIGCKLETATGEYCAQSTIVVHPQCHNESRL
jgi:hypothetical protein